MRMYIDEKIMSLLSEKKDKVEVNKGRECKGVTHTLRSLPLDKKCRPLLSHLCASAPEQRGG